MFIETSYLVIEHLFYITTQRLLYGGREMQNFLESKNND